MTGTKTINVRGAEVIITVSNYVSSLDITITVDVSPLDAQEPDHSPHQLCNYLFGYLPRYKTAQSYWWCKTHYKVSCKTGSQAQRIIKSQLAKIDDAIAQAIIDRDARKAHLNIALQD
jgi:hypothetical protein